MNTEKRHLKRAEILYALEDEVVSEEAFEKRECKTHFSLENPLIQTTFCTDEMKPVL